MNIAILSSDFDCSNSNLTLQKLTDYYDVYSKDDIPNYYFIKVDMFNFKIVFENPDKVEFNHKITDIFNFDKHLPAINNTELNIDAFTEFQEFLNRYNIGFNCSFIVNSSKNFYKGELNVCKYLFNNDGLFMEELKLVSHNDFVKIS